MQLSERLNNRYEVVRQLGDGGFGTTFLVRDHQMPSTRLCVVKQLKPLHDNIETANLVKERFQREAAILETLGEHTQIPRLYAYFMEGDQFYLVEEYIEGDTLTQKVQRDGRQSEATVQTILRHLLPVIDHVHQAQIVHRDIKPDNIILRQSDQKPILIDFGAVKETMGTMLNSAGESARSIVVGTPGYMPAEQLAGRPLYASDLYSLGLTAIYLLTGKIPQALDTDPASGAILWQQLAPNVSVGFANLLDRMIHVVPTQRFSNANAVIAAIDQLNNPLTLAPDTLPPYPQGQPQLQQPQTQPPQPPPPQPATPNFSEMATQAVMPAQPVASTPTAATPTNLNPNPITKPHNQLPKAVMLGTIAGLSILGLSVVGGAFLLKGRVNPTVASDGKTSKVSIEYDRDATSPDRPSTNQPTENANPAPTPKPQQTDAGAGNSPEVGTDATIVGASGSKNIRSGPGTNYDSPHMAYPGDRVKILASSKDDGGYVWHKVQFPKSGAEGWIAAQLVRLDDGKTAPASTEPTNPSEKPATKPSAAPAEPIAEKPAEKPDNNSGKNPANNIGNGTIVGASGSKNVRSGPGTNFPSPHMAYPGDRVEILDTAYDKGGYLWYKVSFPNSGAEGWVAEQLVAVDR